MTSCYLQSLSRALYSVNFRGFRQFTVQEGQLLGRCQTLHYYHNDFHRDNKTSLLKMRCATKPSKKAKGGGSSAPSPEKKRASQESKPASSDPSSPAEPKQGSQPDEATKPLHQGESKTNASSQVAAKAPPQACSPTLYSYQDNQFAETANVLQQVTSFDTADKDCFSTQYNLQAMYATATTPDIIVQLETMQPTRSKHQDIRNSEFAAFQSQPQGGISAMSLPKISMKAIEALIEQIQMNESLQRQIQAQQHQQYHETQHQPNS